MRRETTGVALHFIDLDGFKNVNDTLGHPAGDDLIRQVSARLASMIREGDTVARLGGDEFAVIQGGLHEPAEAELLADRLLEAIRRPFDLLGSHANVSASIGIAMAPDHASTRLELTRKADIALYEAKGGGKNRFRFFAEDLGATVLRKRTLEQDLRQALADGQGLAAVYQPVVAEDGVTLLGAEALLRWTHPRLGPLSPAAFIAVAEERGLIRPLGEWVLDTACRTAVKLDLPWIAVNVSPVQLRDANFATMVLATLARPAFMEVACSWRSRSPA